MADFDLNALVAAGRGLIDSPPPGFVVDMAPQVVSAWLEDGTRDRITVQLIKDEPETRPTVSAVVLTSGLNRAMLALTGAAAGMGPDDTPVTAREIRLAGYAVRLAAVCQNLMANAPGGGFLSFGRSNRWDAAKAKAREALAELVELDTAPVGRLDLPERAGGRSTAAEQVDPRHRVNGGERSPASFPCSDSRGHLRNAHGVCQWCNRELPEQPVSTIPNIDPRQVAGEYIAGRQVPLILPNRPEDKASRDEAEAEAVLDSMGIRPTLPAGYTYVDRPAGAGGNRWQQRVRTWAGEELVAYGDTPREAVAAAVRAAQMHHQPPSRHAEEKAAAFGLPEGYTFAGNAWNAHAPGPWTHYVDHVASGKRLYGHGATPDEARADAVRVAKNHAAAAADSNGADIVDALRMRFDAQIVFPDEVARRAAAEIERLRRELAEVTAARKVTAADAAAVIRQREAVRRELDTYRERVAQLMGKVPTALVILSGNGGSVGPDVLDTLALTVANVVMLHGKATDYAAELAGKLDGAEKTADVLKREADGLRAQLVRESNAVGKLRDELGEAQGDRARVVGELATTRRFLARREDEAYHFGLRVNMLRGALVAVAADMTPRDAFAGVVREVLANCPGVAVAPVSVPSGNATDTGPQTAPAGIDAARADRLRADTVFFGMRNQFYRAAMIAARDLLAPGHPGGVRDAADVAAAYTKLADALNPASGPKRREPGIGDRGPDLFGELLAYREAVADVLTGLDAFDRQHGITPQAVRLAIDTLRTMTDHNATPRQMASGMDGRSPVLRALEDAQKQLADLRAAVAVAGFGIMLLPGAVRLQDMRAEPADKDEDSDHSGTPMGSDVDDSDTEEHPADAANRELSSQLRARTDYANGLRVLLNFAELRARAMAWLLVDVSREDGGDGDRRDDVLRTLDNMGKAVRATLTANAQRLGPLTTGQYAQSASALAAEVRFAIGERDHVPADFYALPLGFKGPEAVFRF